MSIGVELAFDLIELKIASTRLQNLALALDSYKLQFSFNRSQGETADKFIELVEKYNELGANFSQLVKDVKRSTDMTREGIKNADQHISLCWDSLENSFVEEGEPSK